MPAPRFDAVSLLVLLGLLVAGAGLPCHLTLLAWLLGCAVGYHACRRSRWAAPSAIACALVAVALLHVPLPYRERGHRSACKSNLKNLALGLILYRDSLGRATEFPDEDGADFLVSLYTNQVLTEPNLYLCPSTGGNLPGKPCFAGAPPDSNERGALLRLGATPPHACSYAGRRNRDQARYPGLHTTRGASETVIASDDSEGLRRFNHGDAIILLFADGHVEEIGLDPGVTRVGQPGTILEPLAN